MGTTNPTGMSVQALYRLFREDKLFVNRRYQRKLVWTTPEKQALIQSIRKDYPIPLILLAQRFGQAGTFEIVDGMQRLNAIVTFIENAFDVDGKFFDVNELARAKQLADDGVIAPVKGAEVLNREECAQFTEYQLAVTTYPAPSEEAVWDIFRRINSNGRHLSPQETRQAGVLSPFSDLVRTLSAEIRGDSSGDTLLLSQMPTVSIDSPRTRQGYGVHADETFWCRQGILLASQLRDSEDEQLMADLLASILLRRPLATSRELLDAVYTEDSDIFRELDSALTAKGSATVAHEIKTTLSMLRRIIEDVSDRQYALRDTIRKSKSGNPIKGAFYAVFMALYDLLIVSELTPVSSGEVMSRLNNIDERLKTERHHTTEQERRTNIDTVRGILAPAFVKRDPPALRSGAGMLYELENSIRRSAIETSRYECKQGLLQLTWPSVATLLRVHAA